MRKMLVTYSMSSSYVQTTSDYLNALASDLGYDVTFLHVTHDAYVDLDLTAAGYDIVFQNYCTRFCIDDYVSKSYGEALMRFGGLKVMAVQDEYDHTNRIKQAIRDYGFHIVLTCVPADQLEFVYPKAELPGVEFISVLTGYVPDGFAVAHSPARPLADRPIPIGYRGRDIGPKYGRLGFDKYEIGRRMKAECEARGIKCDIAMDDDSRIYGPAWFTFIGNCRAMLGTESGSNVFDFDGFIAEALAAWTKRLGRVPTYPEFQPVIGQHETKINMGQISPRVFECAVMRTPMVLFRGRYSGALLPDEHYIALEPDFSNVEVVLQRIQDIPSLEDMSERAYLHLVASGRFGYRAFGAMLRERFDERLTNLVSPRPPPSMAVAVPTPEQRILREVPTGRPKGLADLQLVQVRRASLMQSAQMRAMEGIHIKSMADSLAGIESVARLRQRWAGDPSFNASDAMAAMADLRKKHRDVMLDRDRRLADRSAASGERMAFPLGTTSSLGAIPEWLDLEWFAELTSRYVEFQKSCAGVSRMLRTEIIACREAHVASRNRFERQAVLQFFRFRDSAILAAAEARGSRIAYAKAVVRRVPFARQMALKVLRFAGRA